MASGWSVASRAPASAYACREAAVSDCRFVPLDRPPLERDQHDSGQDTAPPPRPGWAASHRALRICTSNASRLRALWTEWSVEVRVLSGASSGLLKPHTLGRIGKAMPDDRQQLIEPSVRRRVIVGWAHRAAEYASSQHAHVARHIQLRGRAANGPRVRDPVPVDLGRGRCRVRHLSQP
jgi:hypothetical protein